MLVTFTGEHLSSLSKQRCLGFLSSRRGHNMNSSAKLNSVADARMYPLQSPGYPEPSISLVFW